MSSKGRSPGRSVRVDDDLWQQAQEAARWRGESSVSAVIKRGLAAYIRATNKMRVAEGDPPPTHEERTHENSSTRAPRSPRHGGGG